MSRTREKSHPPVGAGAACPKYTHKNKNEYNNRRGRPRPYGECYWAPTRDAPTRNNYTLRMLFSSSSCNSMSEKTLLLLKDVALPHPAQELGSRKHLNAVQQSGMVIALRM